MEPNQDHEKRKSTWGEFASDAGGHALVHGVAHAVAGPVGGFLAGLFHTSTLNAGEDRYIAQQHYEERLARQETAALREAATQAQNEPDQRSVNQLQK